ncbi:uncharacterized protein METZ01_LOCUS218046, partial [marine metagenome]
VSTLKYHVKNDEVASEVTASHAAGQASLPSGQLEDREAARPLVGLTLKCFAQALCLEMHEGDPVEANHWLERAVLSEAQQLKKATV